jgi:LPXTG-motif cell wall-anchored protein
MLGTYYMKETTVPDGYSDNLTLYKVEVLEDITHVNAYNKVYAQTGEEEWVVITETTNTKEKTDITVSKAWANAGGSTWPADIKSVQIGLYSSVNEEDPVELTAKKCTLDAQHTSYTFEDLLTTDNQNNTITYSVVEESVTLVDDTVVSPEEAGIDVSVGDVTNGAVTVTNTLKPDLPLIKVDKGDHTIQLTGAEFALEKKSEGGTAWSDVTADTVIQNHDGTDAERSAEGYFIIPLEGVVLTELDNGDYQVIEKAAPTGYIIEDNPVLTFKVENGEVKSGNQTITSFEIENTSGAELPYTGGIGTTIFYVLGSLLVLTGGIYFVARRRIAKG